MKKKTVVIGLAVFMAACLSACAAGNEKTLEKMEAKFETLTGLHDELLEFADENEDLKALLEDQQVLIDEVDGADLDSLEEEEAKDLLDQMESAVGELEDMQKELDLS